MAFVKVDIHAHFFPLIAQADTARLGVADAPWLRDLGDGTGFIMAGDTEYRPIEVELWNPAARLAQMDVTGVTTQVMSATPILFGYSAEPDKALDWARMVNDRGLEMTQADPTRLKSMCQVPLQDVDAACAELDRCMAAGHVGVHIGNHVQGRNLDDPELVRFLAHCADTRVPVLIHPWDMMAGERMPNYMLKWLVGMPAETHLAILSLILSGAFERLPSTLRVCFTHGGGNFAQQLGRVDNAWTRRDIVRADCPQLPSSYCDRFFVDSAVFSPESLQLLASVMGADHILMGSDYPFPLGEIEPGSLVESVDFLSEDAKQDILGRNAARFFRISVPGLSEADAAQFWP